MELPEALAAFEARLKEENKSQGPSTNIWQSSIALPMESHPQGTWSPLPFQTLSIQRGHKHQKEPGQRHCTKNLGII